MKLDELKKRVADLIQLADKAKASYEKFSISDTNGTYSTLFQQLQVGGLSFINRIFGDKHVFYEAFRNGVVNVNFSSINCAKGILLAAQKEIKDGWLFDLKRVVSADIFSDFLEMATHLLSEGYKDPAAVMIGSTLEEHLRLLCVRNSIPLATPHPAKNGIVVTKKTDVLNADLTKAQVYNILDQKQVTAWLGLRNSAAHGKYADYTKEQVEAMQYGVMNFITRTT